MKRLVGLVAAVAVLGACNRSPGLPHAAAPSAAPDLKAGVAGPWKECRNDRGRFVISYPRAWYTGRPELTDVHCWSFSPSPLDGVADPELAPLVVREVGDIKGVMDNFEHDFSWRVVDRQDVTVAEHPAVRIETEAVGNDIPFDIGTRFYEYVIDRNGTAFSVGTVTGPDRGGSGETYEIYKQVVDRAAASLRFQ